MAGFTSGMVYFIAVDKTTPAIAAPKQATTTVQGVTLNNGFDTTDISKSNIAASGSFDIDDTVVPFLPNGNFEIYFYFVSSSGNVSANTTVPLSVFMN